MNQWSYALTIEEEAICTRVGFERQEPMLGQPERNRNYVEGDAWETMQHIICAGSELAFARMAGLKNFVPHVNKFKSELDVLGWGEVRYSFPKNWPTGSGMPRGLRITVHDNDDLKYALIVEGLARKTRREAPHFLSNPYVALGWLYGGEAKRIGEKFNDRTWYANIRDLHPMDKSLTLS